MPKIEVILTVLVKPLRRLSSSKFSTNNTNKNTVGGSRSNSSSWSISNDVLLVEELDIMQIPVLIKDFTLQRYKSTIKSPKIFYTIQRSAKLNILNELYNDENILNNLIMLDDYSSKIS
ncbi:hypothetical protein Glove_199g29 [Diversispora epigaea]|uniref:Uncharacterized protein n=1 Tax=Diversispora epigaea TaxID=1348612 RepID=A0A397IJW4_9GLOM|nr:hypothetical protein Glove_199g29 [Diversispora epigaea]